MIEALLNNVANHWVNVPMDKLGVLELADRVLDHVALSSHEVADLIYDLLVEKRGGCIR